LYLKVKLQDRENKDGHKSFDSRSWTHPQSTTPYVGPRIIISAVTQRSHNREPEYWILLEKWNPVRNPHKKF